MSRKIHILSTKKLTVAASKLANNQGFLLTEIPFIKITYLEDNTLKNALQQQSFDEKTQLIFTSPNAVKALYQIIGSQKVAAAVMCLSGATQTAVMTCFPKATIVVAEKNAALLATRLHTFLPQKETLFICGNKRLNTIPDALDTRGFRWKEYVVYTTVPLPASIASHFDAVAFFSPSAVHSFFVHNKSTNNTLYVAIGNTTVRSLQNYTNNHIISCDFPSEEALLQCIFQYFKSVDTHEKRSES